LSSCLEKGRAATAQKLEKEAEESFIRALEIAEQQGVIDVRLNEALEGLGWLCLISARDLTSETHYTRSIQVRKERVGSDHPELVVSYEKLAHLYRNMGKHKDAEALHKEIIRIQKHAHGPDDVEVAKALASLAGFYWLWYKPEEDIDPTDLMWEALRIYRNQLGFEHADTLEIVRTLVLQLQSAQEFAAAETLLREEIARYESNPKSSNKTIAELLILLASNNAKQNKYAEAVYQRINAIIDRSSVMTASSILMRLSEHYQRDFRDRQEKAYDALLRALTLSEEQLGPEHPALLEITDKIISLHSVWKTPETSAIHERRAMLTSKVKGEDSLDYADALSSLADYYAVQTKFDEQIKAMEKVLLIRERSLGDFHLKTGWAVLSLGHGHSWAGNLDQAIHYYQRAEAIAIRNILDTAGATRVGGFVSVRLPLQRALYGLKLVYTKTEKLSELKVVDAKLAILDSGEPWEKLFLRYRATEKLAESVEKKI
jgi:tetratricopeptide (TPR) repeat protein